MITIPEQIWFVLGVGREEDLSYMCPYEVKKDGAPLASTLKMMETGKTWARGYTEWITGPDGKAIKAEKPEPEFKVLANEPTTGIYIGSSVERYTTSNKLFRVKDPRGFTVEVPTDNIATLLHNSTVVNGYIQEPCVWARDGGHILLPVDSTPYREAHAVQESIKSENLVSATSLNYGDRVLIHSQGQEAGPYEFMGRAKVTYEVHWVQTQRSQHSSWIKENDRVTHHPVETITDDKWVTVFCTGTGHKGNYLYDLQQSPKITSVEAGTPSHQLTVETLNKKNYYYLPERMKKRLVTQSPNNGRYDYYDQWSLQVKIVGVELKP